MKNALASAALLLAPRAASACAVCFGGGDGTSGFSRGIWWFIVLILAVTMSLIAALGWLLWSVERRRAKADA
ncbi:MAG: hypothetical protein KGJ84_05085 [Elusimicrobia bacterium]|nr:hypothetical protein [Elusimicrobiota bacterium]